MCHRSEEMALAHVSTLRAGEASSCRFLQRTFQLAAQQPEGGLTSRWNVVTKGGSEKEVGGIVIGRISWWSAWRKYAFLPNAATLYEPTCLRDIATFIDERMAERRRPR